MRKFNEESRRETEAMGEKWIETTALDAKLSRGSAVIALNIANVVDEARARPSKGIRSVNSAPLRQVRFTFH